MPDSGRSTVLIPGNPGKSAYELAVSHGFQGSEQAWLDTLTGQTGPTTSLVNRGTWVSGSTYSPNDYVFAPASGGVGTSVYLVIPRAPFVSVVAPATDTANWLELLSGTPWTVSTRRIDTQYSITGGGDLTSNRTLNLVGDTATPGLNKVYGTDGSGNRGWITLGVGTGDTISDETSSVDSQLVLFSGTTGKHLKKATTSGLAKLTSGVLSVIADNSANWDASFTERRQWDGGSTNLVAATGRTSLGLLNIASSGLPTNKTIWVDPVNGNNGSGVKGRYDLPFATISGALSATGLTSGDVIFLTAGTHAAAAATQVILPPGVHLAGLGRGISILTGTAGTATALVVPGTGSTITGLTIDNSSSPTSSGGCIGCVGANTAFTSALVYDCHLKGGIDGFYFDKTGVTGLQVRNCLVETFYDAVAHGATAPGTMEFRNCSFITTGTSNPGSRVVSVGGGTWKFYECQLKSSGSTVENICVKVTGGTVELHNSKVEMTADGTTNYDLQRTAGTLKVNNVVRPDGAALVTNGTITNISRYTLFSDINGIATPAQLGTGTPTSTKALFGDGAWKTPTINSVTDPTTPSKVLVFDISGFASGVTRTLRPAPGGDSMTVIPSTVGTIAVTPIQPMACKGLNADGTVGFGYPDSAAQTVFTSPNNYTMPAGTGYYQFWNSSSTVNVTGIACSQLDGMTFLVTNSGTNAITLKHESTSSTNVNRFHNSTGADIVLLTDQEVFVRYDGGFGGGGTAARWRVTPRGSVSGGSVVPGGSSGQVQWNSSTTFAGISTLTTDGTVVTQKSGSNYLLADPTDSTKKAQFSLSGITTGTTRTVNIANVATSVTVAGDAGATNNFLTGIGPVTGAITKARPTIANLTDLSAVSKLVGSNASAAAVVEISIGSGLTMTGSTLSASGGAIDDTAFGSSWNGITTIAPSKNAVYDWGHTFDTDDNGKVNVLDMGAGIVKTDASGVVSAAIAGTDYLTANQSITLTGDTTGVGTTSITTTTSSLTGQVQLTQSTSATNSPATSLITRCNSTGTPAIGFGQKWKWQLKDDTSSNQDAGMFGFEWLDAAHATHSSKFTISLSSNGGALGSDDFNVYPLGGGSIGEDVTMPAGVFNALTGFRVNHAATSGNYLRGNGTNFVSSAIQASDVPTLNQNTTGSAGSVALGGITGLGTGVGTALAVNVGTAGAFVVNGGALGTPSSGIGTNLTGIPESGVTNLTTDLGLKAPLASPTFTAGVTFSSAPITLSGNISSAAWTTSGLRIQSVPATLTDTSSSGTVPAAYTNSFGGNTIAASSATTFTNYVSSYTKDPIAGTNVTLTNKWAVGGDSARFGTSNQFAVNNAGHVIIEGVTSTGATGSGNIVFDTSPSLVTPALGTPASGNFSTGTFTWPTFNQNTTGSAAKWTTARNLAGNSVDGSANVAFANNFIVQGTADSGLSAAQFLGALGTGILKNTTTTGVLSIAVAGDFPTLNQNTTGSAATLTTARNIGGVAFDGSANIVPTNISGGNGTTLLGSMPYQSATDTTTQLAPNTTTTKKFLRQTGTGTNGAAPAWDTIVAGDVPTLNQNTTGSAATLTTSRNLWGQAFNGSSNIAGNIELGTDGTTDTTLARASAGVASIEGVNIVTTSSTDTLTNKTISSSTDTLGDGVTVSHDLTAIPNQTGGWTEYFVTGSDHVTSVTTAGTDIAGLTTGTLTGGAVYEFQVVLRLLNAADTTGMKIAIHGGGTGSAATVFSMWTGNTSSATAGGNNAINAIDTLGSALVTYSNGEGIAYGTGFFTARTTGTPTMSIQLAKVTSNNATARVGSVLRIRKAHT